MSLRGASRVIGVARMTIEQLLRDLGAVCARYQDEHLARAELSSACSATRFGRSATQEKNVTAGIAEKHSDSAVWTRTAVGADSKLVLSWLVGSRDLDAAYALTVAGTSHTVYQAGTTPDTTAPLITRVFWFCLGRKFGDRTDAIRTDAIRFRIRTVRRPADTFPSQLQPAVSTLGV